MVVRLYHGPSFSRIEDILEEGIQAPSYWGTLDEASKYASPDGKVFSVEIERFEDADLNFNTLLASSMSDDCLQDGTWEESLAEFGSVRYDMTMRVDEHDLVSIADAVRTDRPRPSSA
jgi:hypothetical protein